MNAPLQSLAGGITSVMRSPSWIARGALGLFLLVAFVGLEWLSSIHEFMSVPITPWNPGIGVVFAFMLLASPLYGLALFAGVIVSELFVLQTELHWPIIVAMASIIALVYGTAAVVTRRVLRLDAGLYHVRDIFILLAGGAVAAIVTSTLVALLLLLDERIEIGNVAIAATPLLVGDVIGIAVMTPMTLRLMMLLQGGASLSGDSRPLALEVALYVVLACAALWVIVGGTGTGNLTYFYLLFVPVILAAVRHGFDGACIALALTQFALVGLMHHFGYDAKAFTEMQTLMVVLTGTALVVGAVVSDRKNTARLMQAAEEKLREKEAEAVQAARFSLVSGMASALAHEINQPMTAARALARSAQHLLSEPSPDMPRAVANIGNVIAQIDHASSVVRRMREFLRRGRPQISTVDVQEMLRDALALARPEAGSAGVELTLSVDPAISVVHADRVQVQQVILNLVHNAIEAIAPVLQTGGQVRVSARPLSDPARIEFAVTDNGPGIAPDRAARLFEPLTTSKREGLGLGLSISLSIVEAHGGRIWLESGDAGKTEFRFTLPLEQA
jgi:two-component system sensor kinase FixL